jgi:RNA polymerase sigma factor (sigma-70 family)
VDPSDSELVERYRRGDAQAFETLVKRYQRRVFALAFGIVHDTEDAHDIGQEAFIKVHRYIDRFEGSASFYTWLYRIVVNLAIDHLRRHCKAPTVEYDDALDRSDASGASAPVFPNRLGIPGRGVAEPGAPGSDPPGAGAALAQPPGRADPPRGGGAVLLRHVQGHALLQRHHHVSPVSRPQTHAGVFAEIFE